MKTPLLELIRCPFCRAGLGEDGEGLRYTGCSRTFGRTDDGIPLMLHEGLPEAPVKLREAAGWLEKARTEGWDGGRLSRIPAVGPTLGTLTHLSAVRFGGVSIYARKRGA